MSINATALDHIVLALECYQDHIFQEFKSCKYYYLSEQDLLLGSPILLRSIGITLHWKQKSQIRANMPGAPLITIKLDSDHWSICIAVSNCHPSSRTHCIPQDGLDFQLLLNFPTLGRTLTRSRFLLQLCHKQSCVPSCSLFSVSLYYHIKVIQEVQT